VGAELFPADGQTDMTKLTVAFRNSACGPKMRIPQNNINPLHFVIGYAVFTER